MTSIKKTFIEEYFKFSVVKPIKFKDLVKILNITKTKEKKQLENILNELVQEGKLIHIKGNRFASPINLDLIVGQLHCTSKGYGFVIPEDPSLADIHVNKSNMNTALHLDKVFVKIISKPRGKNPEGVIESVIQRNIKNIVGKYDKNKSFGFVIPDDPKILRDFFIPNEYSNNAKNGQKVVIEIVKWDSPKQNPVAKIVKILGFPDDPNIDEKIVISEFDLKEKFPRTVEKIANSFTDQDISKELHKRKDLRDTICFTVDPEDAKDFDDAVSLEKISKGYKLGVHIADVSHYVQEGTPLDKEAFKRSTSVYLVNKVIPMLPHNLSNNLCSLIPNVDRLAMSVIINLDFNGNVEKYKIFPSVIRSKKRFNYKEVQEIFNKIKQGTEPEKLPMGKYLKWMYDLSKILREKRINNGSLELEIPEIKIIMDDNKIKEIKIKERLESHQMIEEFMLLANKVVAEFLANNNIPALYRVHDKPDESKINLLQKIINPLGIHFVLKNYSNPKTLQQILNEVRNTSYGYLIERILLRTLKKAKYQPENIGHYALNFTHYTHFTSPIRRYPDLIIHRVLKLAKKKKRAIKKFQKLSEILPDIGIHTSEMERKAEEAERLSVRLKQIEYMKQHIGEEFDGIISSVTNFGVFVELPDNLVEGMIHISEFDDDYYIFHEDTMSIVGKKTKKRYQMGDSIRIKVAAVSSEKKQIDFTLA